MERLQSKFIINQVEPQASVLVTTVLMMIDGVIKATRLEAELFLLLKVLQLNNKHLPHNSIKMPLQSNSELDLKKKRRKTMLLNKLTFSQEPIIKLDQDHSPQ
jgi:hypothetical protein